MLQLPARAGPSHRLMHHYGIIASQRWAANAQPAAPMNLRGEATQLGVR
jgi:hypothetical protein